MKANSFLSLWLWVLLAFALLLGAWFTLFKIAANNPVQIVPLEKSPVTSPPHQSQILNPVL